MKRARAGMERRRGFGARKESTEADDAANADGGGAAAEAGARSESSSATRVSHRLTISSSFCASVSWPRSGSLGGRVTMRLSPCGSWRSRRRRSVRSVSASAANARLWVTRIKVVFRSRLTPNKSSMISRSVCSSRSDVGSVGEQQDRVIDQRPRNRHPPLLRPPTSRRGRRRDGSLVRPH